MLFPFWQCKILRLFADDAYLSILDMHHLQEDLDKLQTWERNWDMEFNPQKYKLLSITNKLKPIPTSYTIHGEELESVETAKCLYLILQKELRWNKHVSSICTKAHQKRSFLQRIFLIFNPFSGENRSWTVARKWSNKNSNMRRKNCYPLFWDNLKFAFQWDLSGCTGFFLATTTSST